MLSIKTPFKLEFLYKFMKIRKLSKYTNANIVDIVEDNVGRSIQIKGWAKNVRRMKHNLFVDINDGSVIRNLQVIINDNNPSQNVSIGDSMIVSGTLSKSPRGQLELVAENYQLIGSGNLLAGYPFVPKQIHPPDYVREYLHLRSRVSTMSSIFRVRHHAARAYFETLDKLGFTQIHTPILTSGDCEGAGELFIVKPDSEKLLKEMAKKDVKIENAFFNRKTFLSVSGQMHLETMCHGLGSVFSFGPTFRAENSKSPVHLSEFYMLECEISFLDKMTDLTAFIENLLKTVTKNILDSCNEDIENILKTNKSDSDRLSWLERPFINVTYKDALIILENHKNQLKTKVSPQNGISKDQEIFLVKHFEAPVFVVEWPVELKAFYMKQLDDRPELVDAVDLLVPSIGELVGGSIRENVYDRLKAKTPTDELDWYLDLRKFGGITTAGFGLGFERYLQFLLDIKNIKDVIPFPRWPHNCSL